MCTNQVPNPLNVSRLSVRFYSLNKWRLVFWNCFVLVGSIRGPASSLISQSVCRGGGGMSGTDIALRMYPYCFSPSLSLTLSVCLYLALSFLFSFYVLSICDTVFLSLSSISLYVSLRCLLLSSSRLCLTVCMSVSLSLCASLFQSLSDADIISLHVTAMAWTCTTTPTAMLVMTVTSSASRTTTTSETTTSASLWRASMDGRHKVVLAIVIVFMFEQICVKSAPTPHLYPFANLKMASDFARYLWLRNWLSDCCSSLIHPYIKCLLNDKVFSNPDIIKFIIIIIYPLTARVVGAPQMISQPVFSIFPCSPLLAGTCRTPCLSIPWCCLPTSSIVHLVFFSLSLCLAR